MNNNNFTKILFGGTAFGIIGCLSQYHRDDLKNIDRPILERVLLSSSIVFVNVVVVFIVVWAYNATKKK